MEKGKVASGVGGVFYMTNLGSKQREHRNGHDRIGGVDGVY